MKRPALTELTHAARGALPLLRRLAGGAQDGASMLSKALVPDEVEARLALIRPRFEAEGDPFGLDLEWSRYALAATHALHRHYFRTEVNGVDRVPSGRVLLISNHSGQVPIDGAMIGASLFFDATPPRVVRSMVEKWSQTLPFVSQLFPRVGQVVGVPENARRLLENEEAVLVFPEGSRGISKPFSERYRLVEFGLGFMRLALETETPIVPVSVVGAEEQYVSLGNVGGLARVLGMPNFPIVPQFFVPGLQLPLPTKYRITFGEPLYFAGDPDDDDAVIDEKVQRVRRTIQSMLNRGLKERRGVFS